MKQKKILLVDDEPINNKVIALQLEKAGYLTQSVNSGGEAWDLLEQTPDDYGVLIADRIMPGVDVLEILNRMQKHPILRAVPVIVQTGIADKSEMIDVVRAGAFDFLHKPIESELLLRVVERAMTLFGD